MHRQRFWANTMLFELCGCSSLALPGIAVDPLITSGCGERSLNDKWQAYQVLPTDGFRTNPAFLRCSMVCIARY